MTSISNRQRFGYSIGHFLNDCCASMWFTYLLMFFKKVINLSSSEAAALMLIGQVVDGCFTPIIGILSDKFIAIPFCTQRKSWHLLGTCLTAISFIFIYNIPLFSDTFSNSQNGTTVPCGSAIKLPSTENLGNAIDGKVFAEESCSSGYDFYYYIPFIIVFQIGWASVQISHLALIPFLTTTNKQRADLNSKRYSLLIVANTFVYVIAWFLFKQTSRGTPCEAKDSIGEEDASSFLKLAGCSVGSGLVMSVLFHALVNEEEPDRETEEAGEKEIPMENKGENVAFMDFQPVKEKRLDTPSDWLSHLPMYTNAIVYMAARLAANCLQIYLTLYITDTIKLPKQYIGILPFVQYIFGFLASFSTKYIHKWHSTAAAYFLGSILVFAAGILVNIVDKSVTRDEWSTSSLIPVFAIFALYGGGGNMVVCSALGLTAELIGNQTKSSAFVYGLMSFGEKIFNGVAVVILEKMNTCDQDAKAEEADALANNRTVSGCTKPECEFYGKFVSYGTSGILVIGLIFVFIQKYVKH